MDKKNVSTMEIIYCSDCNFFSDDKFVEEKTNKCSRCDGELKKASNVRGHKINPIKVKESKMNKKYFAKVMSTVVALIVAVGVFAGGIGTANAKTVRTDSKIVVEYWLGGNVKSFSGSLLDQKKKNPTTSKGAQYYKHTLTRVYVDRKFTAKEYAYVSVKVNGKTITKKISLDPKYAKKSKGKSSTVYTYTYKFNVKNGSLTKR